MIPHPQHARLVDLAREYLTADWCIEAQVAGYLDRHSPASCPPITPQHVRQLMMVLAGRQIVEGAHFPGDRVMHWRRRAQEAA
jgi:hypothetical protein